MRIRFAAVLGQPNLTSSPLPPRAQGTKHRFAAIFYSVGVDHFEQSFQVTSDFSSLLGIGKIRAQLETCHIISNVYTKGKTCS